MHVTVDRGVCVGAGLCALAAPRVFDQDEEGLVLVLQPRPSGQDRDAATEAVSLCPSRAARVSET
ncbi:ferredoxin [Amycolatopsis samaneae]|uniref:Ferredoxin n=1 Tax=Amycolatopsis samaneae TaxID=664691 RepID=A0ABW5GRN8_9PSEU